MVGDVSGESSFVGCCSRRPQRTRGNGRPGKTVMMQVCKVQMTHVVLFSLCFSMREIEPRRNRTKKKAGIIEWVCSITRLGHQSSICQTWLISGILATKTKCVTQERKRKNQPIAGSKETRKKRPTQKPLTPESPTHKQTRKRRNRKRYRKELFEDIADE